MTGDESSRDREWKADAEARKIRVNRRDQLEEILAQFTEVGDAAGRAELEANMLEFEQSQLGKGHSNPVDALMDHLKQEVAAVMAGLVNDGERLGRLTFIALNDEAVSARLRPLGDGSALVYFSDATFTLCHLYSGCAAEGFVQVNSGGPLVSLWRSVKAVRSGRLGADPTLLAGLLRYYYVHQRVFAVAAKLGHQLTRRADPIAYFLTVEAITFVLCHEAAHHVLGHSPTVSAFSPADDLSACSDSQQQELEADLLGYRAAIRVGERAVADTPVAAQLELLPEVGAAMGAMIGMLAIHGTEQALFIRSGRTHPPASARAARLMEQFSPRVHRFAQRFLGDLLSATSWAVDFSPTGQRFDLEWFTRTPRVTSPQPRSYLNWIALLDTLQSRSRQDIAESLGNLDAASSASLAGATRAALAGDAEAALLGWGIPDARTRELCDPHRALEFSTLVEELRASFNTQDLFKGAPLPTAVLAAQLLAQPLGEASRPT